MKTIILVGGFGTRFSEATLSLPKAMIEIGGKPILWHIMNIYAFYGYEEFIVALGYKGEVVKNYFLNFCASSNDLTLDLCSGQTIIHKRKHPNWKVHLVDTGIDTQTGGRIKRLRDWIGDESFLMTYGDGLADVDIKALVSFHKREAKIATVTAVRPEPRFGSLVIDQNRVNSFHEKSQSAERWINGGFFVLEPSIFDYIIDDHSIWEREPLENLALAGELASYCHLGFWQSMDNLKEQRLLESLWNSGEAPWKIWK